MDAIFQIAASVEPWQGLTALGVLGGVIAYLFKLYDLRRSEAEKNLREQVKLHTEELGKRDAREAIIRAEYEAKFRELSEKYAAALKTEHQENRTHEDGVRREFVELMDRISAQAAKSSEGMTGALDRLHTVMVRPSRRAQER